MKKGDHKTVASVDGSNGFVTGWAALTAATAAVMVLLHSLTDMGSIVGALIVVVLVQLIILITASRISS